MKQLHCICKYSRTGADEKMSPKKMLIQAVSKMRQETWEALQQVIARKKAATANTRQSEGMDKMCVYFIRYMHMSMSLM